MGWIMHPLVQHPKPQMNCRILWHFQTCCDKHKTLGNCCSDILSFLQRFFYLIHWHQKTSWGETIVTVWLAAMSLKPLQQLAQTSLSHELSLKTQCLIELSSSGQSNIPTPNGRTHRLWSPPTAITRESSSTSLASLTGSTSDQL